MVPTELNSSLSYIHATPLKLQRRYGQKSPQGVKALTDKPPKCQRLGLGQANNHPLQCSTGTSADMRVTHVPAEARLAILTSVGAECWRSHGNRLLHRISRVSWCLSREKYKHSFSHGIGTLQVLTVEARGVQRPPLKQLIGGVRERPGF